MSDEKKCECFARCEDECQCGAWDETAKIAELKAEIERVKRMYRAAYDTAQNKDAQLAAKDERIKEMEEACACLWPYLAQMKENLLDCSCPVDDGDIEAECICDDQAKISVACDTVEQALRPAGEK